jgi:amino acid transporter
MLMDLLSFVILAIAACLLATAGLIVFFDTKYSQAMTKLATVLSISMFVVGAILLFLFIYGKVAPLFSLPKIGLL